MSNLIQGGISHYSIEEHIKYSNLPELAINLLEQMEEECERRIIAAQECESTDEDDLQEQIDDLESQLDETNDEISGLKTKIHNLEIALDVANGKLTRYQRFTKTVMKCTMNGNYFITYEQKFGLHTQIHTALVENDLDFDV